MFPHRNQTLQEVHNEVEDLNGKRHRDKSSQDIEVRQLKKRLGGVFDNSDLVLKSLEHLSSVVSMVLESNRVAVALEIQDDIDRRRVALMGYKESQASGGSSGSGSTTARQSRASVGRGGSVSVSTGGPGGAMPPVISLDQRCVSCSGQSTTVLAGFKIACLQYHPGPITYNAKVFNRSDLLSVRSKLLVQAHEAIQFGPDAPATAATSATTVPQSSIGLRNVNAGATESTKSDSRS
eukprot:GHVT01102142.1.p1 GENE.GHVT01102142.1~~GHVT01102142.1.p1  ORF type:complete len:237 (-),score=21.76 GHVT01102142.1:201-911(-)